MAVVSIREGWKRLTSGLSRIWDHATAVAGGPKSTVSRRIRLISVVAFLGSPLSSGIFLLRPFVQVRFWPIYGDRIGHLIIETDIFISQIQHRDPRVIYFCFFARTPANDFYAGLLKEKLKIVPTFLGEAGYVFQQTLFKKYYPLPRVNLLRTRSALTKTSKWISDDFTRADVTSLLKKLQVESSRPYVCLWVRDSEYGAQIMSGRDQHFAEHRNADITNYHLLCRTLDSYGFSVVRMGRISVSESLQNCGPYRDYSSSDFNSETNDFLLAKFCSFAICGDSGSVTIPLVYRKPIALANIGGFIGAIPATSVRVLAMKRLEWIGTDRPVSSSEIREFGIHRFNDSEQFRDLGIRHIENTEKQLEGVGLDMLRLLKFTNQKESEKESEIQLRFSGKVRELMEEKPRFVAATRWLRDNPQFAE